ncbi:oligosaccharide flippase family protein [Ligilactobacillus salivarius]|uniref:oligosaccharide flippase family protein n=1 Tax=Ligilactobacillus salivarius TaxID=1624 RepID=UPI00226C2067|nr:oligosaccharide flippase family protein [Ligilactobacillus salivarius]MDE1507157.1 oligosaccharide flippase family protein [Ligilactobacillus salivarius]MDE1521669.1 oligosaccharide flippase family protein [Ligilactobacillus salivarius]
MKNKVFTGFFWKFNEQISSQLVTFIISIILARLLTPKDYGIVALINVFISIADVFVTSGFGAALIQKKGC